MALVRHLLWRQDPSPREEPEAPGRARAFSGTRAHEPGAWRHGEVTVLAAGVRQGHVGPTVGAAALAAAWSCWAILSTSSVASPEPKTTPAGAGHQQSP